MNEQLLLFPPSNEDLSLEISVTKQQVANVRKGLFRRYSQMYEEINKLQEEVKKLSEMIGEIDEAKALRQADFVFNR